MSFVRISNSNCQLDTHSNEHQNRIQQTMTRTQQSSTDVRFEKAVVTIGKWTSSLVRKISNGSSNRKIILTYRIDRVVISKRQGSEYKYATVI